MTKTCSFCSAQAKFLFKSKDYNRRITSEYFDHYRCQRCGLIFISPFPDNLGLYYPNVYYDPPRTFEELERAALPHKFKIDLLKQVATGGKLLEIGPAYGLFAYLAKCNGFEVDTIEMDANCCRFLNETVGVNAINNDDICAALTTLPTYDVIVLWHVIEHLSNPWQTLEAIAKKIKPGGALLLAAPNPDSLQFRLMGKRWPHLDAPRHLMLIPAALIEQKMATLGFRKALYTTRDPGGIGWNFFAWEMFFTNLSNSPTSNKWLRKIGQIIGRGLAPIERQEGVGSAYTIAFHKER